MMTENDYPSHVKKDGSNKTRNILIWVIVILAIILVAVLVSLTFCTRKDAGDESNETEEGEEAEIVSQEGTVDKITDESIELNVDGDVILIQLDGYKLPEDLATGDKVYVEYEVDKIAEQNILKYLKILGKANEPPEENIVKHIGYIDRISSDSIYLEIKAGVVLIYIDGYKLPDDLAVGDKVYIEYEADKIAEQNILRYLEIIEKAEVSEAPTISLEVYEGPVYVQKDNICYYRIRVVTAGKPAPEISWSRDDSGGSLGSDKAQISLKDVNEKYTLEATAKNSAGTAKDKIEIKWGCEKPPTNRPPEIKEIVIMDDLYTETKYPVYVIATDPDGDTLSYKWSAAAGTVEKSTSNPMFWTTPATAGNYDIKITIDDGNNGVATKTKSVEVKKKEEPPEPPEEEITDIIWQWEKFVSSDDSQIILRDPTKYMLFLKSDGDMYILADCNSGSGTYTKGDSSLDLYLEIITQAMCGSNSLSDKYILYLESVVTYVLDDGKLYLDLKADAGNMVFINGENIQ